MKTLFALILTAASSLASAKEINLGVVHNGKELPQISVLPRATTTSLRVAVNDQNIHCSRYRPDLCGLEDRVKIVEVTLNSNQCHILSATLLTCSLSLGNAQAILDDGSRMTIHSIAGTIKVGHQISVDHNGQQQDIVVLSIEIWGHRADGLDPIIQNRRDTFFWQPVSLVEIGTSLF